MPVHFLSLPLEVRTNIFEQFLDDFDSIYVSEDRSLSPRASDYRYHPSLKTRGPWPTLPVLIPLTICKQLHDEILPTVHSRLPIRVNDKQLLANNRIRNLIAPLTAAHIACVGHLVLDCSRDHGSVLNGYVPIQQQRNLFASFPALQQVTFTSQWSLWQAFGRDLDVYRLRVNRMHLFEFIEEENEREDEETAITIKTHLSTSWMKHQIHRFKNGNGAAIRIEMALEVGRFSMHRSFLKGQSKDGLEVISGDILVCMRGHLVFQSC